MRLLINSVGAVTGGAARHLPPFLTALTKARPDWHLCVCVSPNSPKWETGVLRATPRTIPDSGSLGRLRWDATGITAVAREERSDCILNLTNYGPLAPHVPSILYQRNPIYFDPNWVARLPVHQRIEAATRRALAFKEMAASDVTITPSDAMGGFLRAWRSKRVWQTVTVPHAIDASRFAFNPRPMELSRPLSILVVSHPGPHKGLTTGIRVIRDLRVLGVDASLTFTIARNQRRRKHSRYVNSLVSLAGRLGVTPHVSFAGPSSAVEDLYHRHDLLLFPSFTESFGFPLLEAMSCGLPIVASAIPSTIEVLATTGSYFAAGDSRGAAGQISQLGSVGEAFGHLQLERARTRATTYTWDRNAAAIVELVEGRMAARH